MKVGEVCPNKECGKELLPGDKWWGECHHCKEKFESERFSSLKVIRLTYFSRYAPKSQSLSEFLNNSLVLVKEPVWFNESGAGSVVCVEDGDYPIGRDVLASYVEDCLELLAKVDSGETRFTPNESVRIMPATDEELQNEEIAIIHRLVGKGSAIGFSLVECPNYSFTVVEYVEADQTIDRSVPEMESQSNLRHKDSIKSGDILFWDGDRTGIAVSTGLDDLILVLHAGGTKLLHPNSIEEAIVGTPHSRKLVQSWINSSTPPIKEPPRVNPSLMDLFPIDDKASSLDLDKWLSEERSKGLLGNGEGQG